MSGILLVFLICVGSSLCILLPVEPLRRKYMHRVEYDVQDKNPWDEMLNPEGKDSRNVDGKNGSEIHNLKKAGCRPWGGTLLWFRASRFGYDGSTTVMRISARQRPSFRK